MCLEHLIDELGGLRAAGAVGQRYRFIHFRFLRIDNTPRRRPRWRPCTPPPDAPACSPCRTARSPQGGICPAAPRRSGRRDCPAGDFRHSVTFRASNAAYSARSFMPEPGNHAQPAPLASQGSMTSAMSFCAGTLPSAVTTRGIAVAEKGLALAELQRHGQRGQQFSRREARHHAETPCPTSSSQIAVPVMAWTWPG
jgi:hypothetical protein